MTTEEKIEYVDFLFHHSGKAWENRGLIFDYLFDLLEEEVPIAATWLAEAYETEKLTEYDFECSYAYTKLAKNLNDPEGLYFWSKDNHYYRDEKFRLNLLKRSAEQGYPDACHDLAEKLIDTEPDKAIELFKKGTADNNKWNLIDYGIALYSLNRDLEEAFRVVNQAYEKDTYKVAVLCLAFFYDNGVGVEKDINKACELYFSDHHLWTGEDARGFLALHILNGKCNLKTKEEAFEDLKIVGGNIYVHPNIYALLSICYQKGLYTEVDLEKADKYKKKAHESLEKIHKYSFLKGILL